MKLVPFADLWTLAHHPSRECEWSLDQKFEEVRAAGFQGIAAPLDIAVASLAMQNGLFSIGMIFPDGPEDFARILKAQKEFGTHHVSVQLGAHDTSPAEAAKRWIKLEKIADDLDLEISLETHRDSATETPEKLFELADRYAKATGRVLRLSWDFSHWAIVKHLHNAQHIERLLARPELVQHATLFRFRPFNAHHAQVAVTHNGDLTIEVIAFLEFAQEVMRIWKSAPGNRDRNMYACASLGPKGGCALTHFPPVWPDAVVLSSELQKRWDTAV
ncbi:MAG TPA: hypothetical protein VFT72_05140 [Opitutaceae bacterium]|nr:hypothetical protein [Opitutaceae bacterium]